MNTQQNNYKTFLVLGAGGKTGRRVANLLKSQNYATVSGSRSAKIPFDWENSGTWEKVVQDIDAVYLAFQPDLAMPGSAEIIGNFCKVALNNGVKKVVLLSGRGEPEAVECEKAVINSGMKWTIIRASWFCQNFSEGVFLDQIRSGYVALPAGETTEPFVDTDDIAEIAFAALTDDKHNSQIYEVTGPGMLSFHEAIEAIAAATGKPIQYQDLSIEDYRALLTEHHVPEEIIDAVTYLFSEILDGRNESTCDGVERALGRKATSFSEFAEKAAASGVWS